jgi:hypothetical protein
MHKRDDEAGYGLSDKLRCSARPGDGRRRPGHNGSLDASGARGERLYGIGEAEEASRWAAVLASVPITAVLVAVFILKADFVGMVDRRRGIASDGPYRRRRAAFANCRLWCDGPCLPSCVPYAAVACGPCPCDRRRLVSWSSLD